MGGTLIYENFLSPLRVYLSSIEDFLIFLKIPWSLDMFIAYSFQMSWARLIWGLQSLFQCHID